MDVSEMLLNCSTTLVELHSSGLGAAVSQRFHELPLFLTKSSSINPNPNFK